MADLPAGPDTEADQLILDAATGARRLTPDELSRIIEHVAQAGFDPRRNVPASGFSGVLWQGRLLRGSDLITSTARHYLRHVVKGREWPDGTSLEEYVASIQRLILDARSGAFTSRYRGQWQLGMVRRSLDVRGPQGFPWVLIEYRVGLGHWVTAFQPREGIRVLRRPDREELRWLHRPS